jgi:uncharacterized protein YjbI with pentapeptide repeats
MAICRDEHDNAKCSYGSGQVCGRDAYKDDDSGRCICHSKKPNKDPDAFQSEIGAMLREKNYDFSGFVFPAEADFSDREFESSVRFGSSVFRGAVSFKGSTFRGDADFREAEFVGDADFNEAVFVDTVNFTGARFNDCAHFLSAQFRGRAKFAHARFQLCDASFRCDTYFTEATFECPVDFIRAKFHGAVHFTGVTFRDAALFVGYGDDRIFSDQRDAGFEVVRFERPHLVGFQHVCLKRARFPQTDVRKVSFVDVKWAERPGGRPAVWDELRPEPNGKKDYAMIGWLYRQLKYNYEEQRDPIPAGDFHFGEMEMRRRLGKGPVFLWLYRVLSGYGESYLRALGAIGLVILAFAAAFAKLPALAIQVVPPSGTPHIVGEFWPSLLYSGMCFLLRPDKPYQPVHMEGRYVSVAEGIIGPALIAMFVLALNRRFKR